MRDIDTSVAGRGEASGRGWLLWLRIAGLAVFGGVLLLVISLPGLASDEQQSGPGVGVYVALVLVAAGVMSRTYVIARRAAMSRRRALSIAVAAIPASYAVAVSIIWLIVTVS